MFGGLNLSVDALQNVDRDEDSGGSHEDSDEEDNPLCPNDVERLTHDEETSDEEGKGHNEGDNVHGIRLAPQRFGSAARLGL